MKESVVAVLAALLVAPAASQAAPRNFADLSLEELMNESVTSVSRKQTRLGDSAAAISVITQEDIRRSGHTSLAELLRLVPGMQVARIHANEWAITARGFNDQYANKLLVMVDGRSVYSPMFAGVYWNAQDVLLQDLDRIEVIRGPGATLWGANAVNGVINVTTKSAGETQGTLVAVSAGTEDQPSVAVRYGGEVTPSLHYRVYAKYFDQPGFNDHPGERGSDRWRVGRLGARLDWTPSSPDAFTLQSEYYRGSVGEHFEGVSLTPPFTTHEHRVHGNFGGNVLARWSRQTAPGSELEVQTYYDRFHHGDGDITETRDTIDFELRQRFGFGARHDLVWGAGYRLTTDRLASTFYLRFDPERAKQRFYSAFVQDEISLPLDGWKLTVGAKAEHDEHTGLSLQPSARLLWSQSENRTLWTSVSRAVRRPSRYDRHSRLNAAASQQPGSPPFLVALLGNASARPEKLDAYELGYRFEPNARFSLDVAGFYHTYEQLLSYVPGAVVFEIDPAPAHLLLPLSFRNAGSGDTYGGETSVQWRAHHRLKLMMSHTWLSMHITPDASTEQQNPRHQFQLRGYLDLPRGIQFNTAAYYVRNTTVPLDNGRARIGSHVRFDAGVTWRPTPKFELGLWGQNLAEPRHPEFGSFKTRTLVEIPRSYSARAVWTF